MFNFKQVEHKSFIMNGILSCLERSIVYIQMINKDISIFYNLFQYFLIVIIFHILIYYLLD